MPFLLTVDMYALVGNDIPIYRTLDRGEKFVAAEFNRKPVIVTKKDEGYNLVYEVHRLRDNRLLLQVTEPK